MENKKFIIVLMKVVEAENGHNHLSSQIKDNTNITEVNRNSGYVCPECGCKLKLESGCKQCLECGYSKCG